MPAPPPLVAYSDLKWSSALIEKDDLEKIYIISSDDWSSEGLCVPDFRLKTAIDNYSKSTFTSGKYVDIKVKEDIFTSNPGGLDTKLIMVSNSTNGPFTVIEGNKRSIALYCSGRLVGLEIYIGVSPAVRSYVWARHSFS